MSKAQKLRAPATKETREKLSLVWKGRKRKPFIDEHRKKMSDAAKARGYNKPRLFKFTFVI